jgi:hypothetical protein
MNVPSCSSGPLKESGLPPRSRCAADWAKKLIALIALDLPVLFAPTKMLIFENLNDWDLNARKFLSVNVRSISVFRSSMGMGNYIA